MRFFVVAVLLLAIDWYAFQAICLLLNGTNGSVSLAITIGYWAVPVIALAYLWSMMHGLTSNWPVAVKVIVRTVVVILYFSKFIVAVFVLVDDLRRLLGWVLESTNVTAEIPLDRSRFLSQLGLGLGILPVIFLTYGMIRNPYRYKVHSTDLPIVDLHRSLENLRIVQISDIHAGSFLAREPVKRSIELINSLNPDIVCFTGDLVNSSADEADDFIEIFAGIEARYGVFSVLGNHDYGDYQQWPSEAAKRANFSKLTKQHERMGWQLLLNEHAVVKVDEAQLGIIGVENYSAHPRFPKYGDMPSAISGMPSTDLQILLSHDPTHWQDEIVDSYPNVDLTLAGHTHGFQFGLEIPGFIKWSPVQYVYKQWAGLYRQGKQYLYVNRGLGYLGYPGRVGILPEITLLTLSSAARQD